jgi:hypothetical protein
VDAVVGLGGGVNDEAIRRVVVHISHVFADCFDIGTRHREVCGHDTVMSPPG